MVSEKAKNNAGYLSILAILGHLKEIGVISKEEFDRAREYYTRLTGADIFVPGL